MHLEQSSVAPQVFEDISRANRLNGSVSARGAARLSEGLKCQPTTESTPFSPVSAGPSAASPTSGGCTSGFVSAFGLKKFQRGTNEIETAATRVGYSSNPIPSTNSTREHAHQ